MKTTTTPSGFSPAGLVGPISAARMFPAETAAVGGGGGGGAAAPAAPTGGSASGGAPPAAGGEGAKPPAPRIEKIKYVVDGSEIEEEVPYEKLVAGYRKGAAADKRFREVATREQQLAAREQRMQDLEELVLKNPIDAWKHVRKARAGAETQEEVDEIDFLTQNLEQRIAEKEKLQDPKDRALAEERRRREELEQRERDREAQQKETVRKQEIAKRRDEYAKTFGEALSTVKMPKNEFTLELMAKAFFENKRNGIDLSPAELAEETRAGFMGTLEGAVEGIPDDQLLDFNPKLTQRFFKAMKARHARRNAPKPVDGGGESTFEQPRQQQSENRDPAYQKVRGFRTI